MPPAFRQSRRQMAPFSFAQASGPELPSLISAINQDNAAEADVMDMQKQRMDYNRQVEDYEWENNNKQIHYDLARELDPTSDDYDEVLANLDPRAFKLPGFDRMLRLKDKQRDKHLEGIERDQANLRRDNDNIRTMVSDAPARMQVAISQALDAGDHEQVDLLLRQYDDTKARAAQREAQEERDKIKRAAEKDQLTRTRADKKARHAEKYKSLQEALDDAQAQYAEAVDYEDSTERANARPGAVAINIDKTRKTKAEQAIKEAKENFDDYVKSVYDTGGATAGLDRAERRVAKEHMGKIIEHEAKIEKLSSDLEKLEAEGVDSEAIEATRRHLQYNIEWKNAREKDLEDLRSGKTRPDSATDQKATDKRSLFEEVTN